MGSGGTPIGHARHGVVVGVACVRRARNAAIPVVVPSVPADDRGPTMVRPRAREADVPYEVVPVNDGDVDRSTAHNGGRSRLYPRGAPDGRPRRRGLPVDVSRVARGRGVRVADGDRGRRARAAGITQSMQRVRNEIGRQLWGERRGESRVGWELPAASERAVDGAVVERRPERGDEENGEHHDRGRGGDGRVEEGRSEGDDGGRRQHHCPERDSGSISTSTGCSPPLIRVVDGGHRSANKLWWNRDILAELIIVRD